LAPEAVASWIVRFGRLSKFQVDLMFEELTNLGSPLDILKRKILVVDRKAIGASTEPLA
jgi:hypothetical protein